MTLKPGAGSRAADLEGFAVDFRFRIASVTCAFVLLLGVISAFAVGGDEQDVAAEGSDDARAQSGDDVVAEDSIGATTTTSPSAQGSSTSTDPSDAADADAAPTSAPTTSEPSSQTSSAPTSTAPLGTTATTPGSYTYDITGTIDGQTRSGSSTLVVPAADSNGRQAQVQSGGPDGKTTTVYRFTPEGTYLESMTTEAQGMSLELAAKEPILIIPAGAPEGNVATGTLVITGLGLTADLTVTLTQVGSDTATVKIDADISGSTAGCSVDGEMTSTMMARTSDQLPLDTVAHTEFEISGLLCALKGTSSSDVHTVLRR